MVTDARSNTKTWIDTYWTAANVTKDDGSTLASTACMYADPNYPLLLEFRAPTAPVDGLILIGEPNSTPMMDPVTRGPYGYEEHIPITVATIDKTGVTGTKLKWKIEAELRRIAETQPLGSVRSFERRGDKDQRLGSTVIYMTEWVLNYRRDTT